MRSPLRTATKGSPCSPATRESPHTATKTQRSQKKKKIGCDGEDKEKMAPGGRVEREVFTFMFLFFFLRFIYYLFIFGCVGS